MILNFARVFIPFAKYCYNFQKEVSVFGIKLIKTPPITIFSTAVA